MKMRRRLPFLVPLSALSFLGTSRPLLHKVPTGTVAVAPSDVASLEPPKILLRENVNNQGCFAAQKIDLTLSLPLRNGGSAPLVVEDQNGTVNVDGRTIPTRFVVVAADGTAAGRFEWGPGANGSVRLSAEAMADKATIEAHTIDVLPTSSRGPVRVRFTDVDKTPTSEGRISKWP